MSADSPALQIAPERREWQGRYSVAGLLLALAVALASVATLTSGLSRGQQTGLLLASVLPLVGAFFAFARRAVDTNAPKARIGRQRVRLTLPAYGTLVIMTVLFTGSLLGRSNPLMLVASMLAGPFVVNGWLTYSMLRRIDVRRRLRDRVSVDEPLWVDVELSNDKHWMTSWLMTVEDQVTSEHESFVAQVLFHRVPRRDSRSARYRLELARRGRYTIGPATVSTGFPLDFVRRHRRIEESSEVLVHPRVGRINGTWSRRLRAAESVSREHASRIDGSADEFHRLREYRFGDSTRKIHWRTSARRNELMVREDRQRQRPMYAVLVDLWQPEDPTDEQLDRVEYAVSMAASLAVGQLRANRDGSVTVAVTGETTQRWVGQSGPAGMEALLDELALVRAGVEADPVALVSAGNTDRAVTTVLVTTRSPAELEQRLTEPDATRSGRSSQRVVVEASPEELARMLTFE